MYLMASTLPHPGGYAFFRDVNLLMDWSWGTGEGTLSSWVGFGVRGHPRQSWHSGFFPMLP